MKTTELITVCNILDEWNIEYKLMSQPKPNVSYDKILNIEPNIDPNEEKRLYKGLSLTKNYIVTTMTITPNQKAAAMRMIENANIKLNDIVITIGNVLIRRIKWYICID